MGGQMWGQMGQMGMNGGMHNMNGGNHNMNGNQNGGGFMMGGQEQQAPKDTKPDPFASLADPSITALSVKSADPFGQMSGGAASPQPEAASAFSFL